MSTDAYNLAVKLLSRREHGAKELHLKLLKKGFDENAISEAITDCQNLNFQCDKRFTLSAINSLINRGFGINRIKQELKHKGIDSEILDIALDELSIAWYDIIARVANKKFGNIDLELYENVVKVKRFLLYRGFDSENINKYFKSC